MIYATSYVSGKSPKIVWMSFSSMSSAEPPSPPPDSAEHSKTESKSKLVSLISFVISAFE